MELRKTQSERERESEGVGVSPKYNNATPLPPPVSCFWYFVFVFVGTRGIHNKAVIVLPPPPTLTPPPLAVFGLHFLHFPAEKSIPTKFVFLFLFRFVCSSVSLHFCAAVVGGVVIGRDRCGGGEKWEAVEKQTAILCVVHGEKRGDVLNELQI